VQVLYLRRDLERGDEIFGMVEALIHTEVDESYCLALEVGGSRDHSLDLLCRGLAPRSPEVDHQNFPRVVLKLGFQTCHLIC
jgi:hypothetical protein